MKVVQYDSGGYVFNINVPESVDEYDSLAKKSGACLEAAIDHEVYHGTLGDIREGFVKAVEKETGISRREVGTGVFEGEGEERKEVTKTEKNDVFLARVAAEKNLTGEKPFQSIADSLSAGGANEVKFDPSVRERKAPKPTTPPKWAIEGATKFLATASDKQKQKFMDASAAAGFTIVPSEDTNANIQQFAKGAVAIKAATPVFGA